MPPFSFYDAYVTFKSDSKRKYAFSATSVALVVDYMTVWRYFASWSSRISPFPVCRHGHTRGRLRLRTPAAAGVLDCRHARWREMYAMDDAKGDMLI